MKWNVLDQLLEIDFTKPNNMKTKIQDNEWKKSFGSLNGLQILYISSWQCTELGDYRARKLWHHWQREGMD
jgi:hypothetical protein